jgi:hypothetical protein
MALGLKYQVKFKDIHIGDDYAANIYEEGFVGTSTELIAGPNPIMIKYESSEDDLFSPIRGSYAEIELFNLSQGQFEEFLTSNAFQYQCRIFKNGSTLLWQGWIVNDRYQEPYKQVPYPSKVRFSDGLGLLKNYDVPITQTPTKVKLFDLIYDALSILLTDSSVVLLESCDIYENNMANVANTDSPLNQTYVWEDVYEGKNYYQVLEDIMKRFLCQIKQKDGNWQITRTTQLGASYTQRRWSFGVSDFVYVSNTTIDPIKSSTLAPPTTSKSNMLLILSGGRTELRPAAKNLIINQDFGLRDSVITIDFDQGIDRNEEVPKWPSADSNIEWYPVGGRLFCYYISGPNFAGIYQYTHGNVINSSGTKTARIDWEFECEGRGVIDFIVKLRTGPSVAPSYYLNSSGAWVTSFATAFTISKLVVTNNTQPETFKLKSNKIPTGSYLIEVEMDKQVATVIDGFYVYNMKTNLLIDGYTENKGLLADISIDPDNNETIKYSTIIDECTDLNTDPTDDDPVKLKNIIMIEKTGGSITETSADWDILGESESDALNTLVGEEIGIQRQLPQRRNSVTVISPIIDFSSTIQDRTDFRKYIIHRGTWNLKKLSYNLELLELSDGSSGFFRVTEAGDQRVLENGTDNRILE